VTTRETPTDDWLDAALAADAAEHRASYVGDDGFTMRVIDALPASVSLPAWRRRAVGALWAVAGIGAAFALPGTFVDVAREAFRLVGGQAISLSGVATAIAAAAAVTWAATAYVLRRD
jgi:hypothetical protein